jgi:type IV pilus assembly protein PilY1
VQSIRLQDTGFGREVRTITGNVPNWNEKQGWYVDLLDPPTPPGTAQGERVVSASLIRFGRVIFVTTIPSSDPCSPGGTSWLMELDLVTGGTFAESILDLNNDNAFDARDTIRGEVISGVRTAALGISKTPLWLDSPDDSKAFKLMTGTGGGFVSEKNRKPARPPEEGSVFRRSWIQIR